MNIDFTNCKTIKDCKILAERYNNEFSIMMFNTLREIIKARREREKEIEAEIRGDGDVNEIRPKSLQKS